MARIKKFAPEQNLTSFQTFLVDENPNSDYFRITEFKDTFTGGKNGFLIEGSEYLKESTEIKIEILDVEGNPVYYEPGNGIPEYYEGISKLVAVYVYEDTPIGLGKITILGELKEYDDNGVKRQVPSEWQGAYNVKWERTFQINKNLSNEDRVRFYRRPKVAIDEIVKPIFNKTPQTITQTGQVDGLPLIPTENTQLSNFSLPTSYRLRVTDDTYWTGSVVGQQMEFSGLNYSPTITDIVNKQEVLVSPPYSESDLVKGFSAQNYSVSFPYLEGAVDLATALTGSFAKINITDMKTFVGDAARVKVFRKSVSQLTDYEFVQEIQLESNELLRDLESVESTETFYGNLSENYINNYWLTSSNDLTTTFNQDFLYNSVELDNGVSTPQYFFTSQSLSVTKDVEYNLSFNVRKRTNTSTDDYLKVYLSGSFGDAPTSQTLATINSSNEVLQKTTISENIVANDISSSQLYFEVKGNDWLINDISLRAAEETSFSPDEITFIQSVPKTLAEETFDFRFEFYDINNNYIPVLVEETKTFNGGNLNLFTKELTLTPNQLYFAFDSASAPANPLPPLNIFIDVEKRVITGSVTFTSGAYDEFGNLLSSSQYNGGVFPGLLTDRDKDIVKLNVSDFTGSRDDITVQYIEYTGEVEGVTDSFVITRVQDGKGGVNFEIRPYRGTIIKNKDDKELEVQAIRIDGINEITLKDNLPQTGFSDAKLRVLSSSIDENTLEESGSYLLLSEASSSKFIKGLNAGLTGSGEINYNARFNRDSIDGELTVFLMDNATSESILTSIILTDLQDGLDSGFVTFDADVFTINPRTQTQFTPTYSSVTGSFYKRGTRANPVSASIEIFPSMSINSDFVPEYWMYFVSHSKDETIEVTAYDENGINVTNGEVGSYIGLPQSQSKQLLVNFTYTEPITSASVQVDHIFTIVPEGKPGDETVLFEVNPQIVNLKSDSRGTVEDFKPSITDISLRQGARRLIFTGSGEPGTFTIASESISSNNIEVGLLHLTSSFGVDYTASLIVSESSNFTQLSGSITYPFEIRPYFTSSVYTQSFTQNFTKTLDGPPPIEVNLVPQSVTLIADEVEYISDYSNANTFVTVTEGNDSLVYTGSGEPGTFTLESVTTKNITSNITAIEGDLSASVEFSEFEYPYVSASATYNVNVFPYSLGPGHQFTSSVYEKTQNFVKSVTPSKARSVELSATTTTVTFDGDGVVTSPTSPITLTADAYNTSGSIYYGFFRDGFTWQPYSQTNTLTIASGDATEKGGSVTWEVRIKDGGTNADVFATDTITISGISDGATNYNVQLDNPSVTLTVEVDGTTTLTNSGATIRAYKGSGSLEHVTQYSLFDGVFDEQGLFIGNLGQYSASVHYVDSFLTQNDTFSGNPASIGNIGGWSLPQDNPNGTIVYKVDIENGRATYFLSQSFAASFEGATGPGIVVRGEWTGSIDYLFTETRRDAVFREISGDVHYWATTADLVDAGSPPYTFEPDYTGPPSEGDIDSNGWQYLGMQDFFVAAKLAIFEESFVKNTINVGTPPDGNPNANIAIVGGTDEPYIAIGQTGTQGYAQPGVFIGMTNDGGPVGTSGTTGLLSLKSTPSGGTYNSLEWDGETLTIRGAIRQTSAGIIEGSLRGNWSSGVEYYPNDIVSYGGQSYVMIATTSITSTNDSDIDTGFPDVATNSWDIAASAGTSGINGTNGAVGEPAGVTYAGVWDDNVGKAYESGSTYMGEDTLKYVVKYGSDYYVSKISHTPRGLYNDISGETFYSEDSAGTYVPDVVRRNLVWYKAVAGAGPFSGVTPGVSPAWQAYWEAIGSDIDPANWTDGWEAFGAQFTSVATDILFAQDVYANRTINIGTAENGNPVIALNADSSSGYANPYISIGQTIQAFEEDGIFLGYTEQTASLSILSDDGAKVNIGGLNVDRNGMFFEDTLELPPFTQVSSPRLIIADTGSGFTFPPEIVHWGNVSYGGSTVGVTGYSSSFAIELDTADYEVSITSWDISYFSASYEIPVGGPATKPGTSFDLMGWRDDPIEHPEQATTETWFVDWSINKNTTIAGYSWGSPNYDVGEGYNYLTLRTGTLLSELGITDQEVGELRGDGNPLPSVGGGDGPDPNTVLGFNPTGSMPTIWIDAATDGDQNFTWANTERVAYQVLDVVNSGNPSNTTGYDTFVLGARVYPSINGNSFEDDFSTAESTYSLAEAQNGTAPTTTPSGFIASSLFKNVWLSWPQYKEDSSTNYTNTELSIGFLQGNPIQIDSIRLHSSGSNGNSRPYLSMGQVTQSYDENGVYLGFQANSDIPVMSLKSTLNSMKWDGETLRINGRIEGGGVFGTDSVVEGAQLRIGQVPTNPSEYFFEVDTQGNLKASGSENTFAGTITANDGRIGDWIIDPDTLALRDEDREIVLDPEIPEIGLYSGSGATKTVRVSPVLQLAEPDASGITITNMGALSDGYESVTSSTTGNFPPTYGSFTTASNSDGFSGVEDGTYAISFTLPTLGMSSTTTTTVDGIVLAPNYNATSPGQVHGSYLTSRGSAGYEIYVDLLDSDGTTILQSQRIALVQAFSQYEFGDVYVSEDDDGGDFGGPSGFSSVTGDTLIQLVDGTLKRADEIDGDDWLLVWDEREDKLVPSQIAAKKERWVNEYYIVKTKEREIKVSDTHGFYLDGDVEIKVQDLIVGETEIYIYTDGGTLVKSLVLEVEHITQTNSDIHVISFSTPPYKNYISDGILSHNYVTYPWQQQLPTTISAQSGNLTASTITRNFTFNQGNGNTYYMRYKWRGLASSGFKYDTAANGTQTLSYVTQTSNYIYASGVSNVENVDPSILVPTNITEITGKGMQVLSGQNQYVRLEREEANDNILKVAGGNILFGFVGDTAGAGQSEIKPAVDNYYNLGTNSLKWRYIYSNNALQTSDRNQKKNILDSDLGLSFINQLNPVKYQWLDDVDDSPYHYGLIAQDVNEVASKDDVSIITEESGSWNMAYNELISPMIKAIQELTQKVNELEAQISGSL